MSLKEQFPNVSTPDARRKTKAAVSEEKLIYGKYGFFRGAVIAIEIGALLFVAIACAVIMWLTGNGNAD